MVNVARLQKELEFITGNRNQWNQRTWANQSECGTTGCLAGWTVMHEERPGYSWRKGNCLCSENCEETNTLAYRNASGLIVDFSNEAARILELNHIQQAVLFEGGNSLTKLWRLASYYSHGEIKIPIEFQEDSNLLDIVDNDVVATNGDRY